MSWYYNVGTKVVSVDVGNGEVVATRPQSYVYVDATQENSVNLRYLVSKNVLQRCSAPKGLKKQSFVPVDPVVETKLSEVEVSSFAKSVEEGISSRGKKN